MLRTGIVRELKMTVVCKSCEHQYGAWRDRCPACGTSTPQSAKVEPVKAQRAKRTVVSRKPRCTFCTLLGKTLVTCPHCDENIHKDCLPLHVAACAQFQIERVAAERALA